MEHAPTTNRFYPTAVLVLVICWFLYQMFGPNPPIKVARQTTWITEPLNDCGLPDFETWYKSFLSEGVTPENNAAIPVLQAMWPADIPAEHQAELCVQIGMPIPQNSGFKSTPKISSLDDQATNALAIELLK